MRRPVSLSVSSPRYCRAPYKSTMLARVRWRSGFGPDFRTSVLFVVATCSLLLSAAGSGVRGSCQRMSAGCPDILIHGRIIRSLYPRRTTRGYDEACAPSWPPSGARRAELRHDSLDVTARDLGQDN